jgi:hypothetical protein
LRDLETKVKELQKSSDMADQENGLLRAHIERLQVELCEYRKQVSWMTSNQYVSTMSAIPDPHSKGAYDLQNGECSLIGAGKARLNTVESDELQQRCRLCQIELLQSQVIYGSNPGYVNFGFSVLFFRLTPQPVALIEWDFTRTELELSSGSKTSNAKQGDDCDCGSHSP